MTILIFFLTFSFFPSLLLSYQVQKLYLPHPTIGPEALAFDSAGVGPYTGVSDGRVLKYINQTVGFVDFAITSPTRPKLKCDGNVNPALEPICGRPLGLGFDHKSGCLYIADAYFGLRKVGPKGGIAIPLSKSAQGVPYKFLNALDVDPNTGIVYFTDASSVFVRSQFVEAYSSGDKTGRLLRYDPRNKKVTVLLQGLGLPVGVAVSENGKFVVVSELLYSRVLRFWLKGPKANKTEIFATLPAPPDNIKRNAKGEFWVPINNVSSSGGKAGASSNILSIGEDYKLIPGLFALKFDEAGILRKQIADANGSYPSSVQYSEFQEFGCGTFFVGSLNFDYVIKVTA